MHSQAAASARNLANMRRDVLHRVTHELRTPLNGLVGSVELLSVSEMLRGAHPGDVENVLTMQQVEGSGGGSRGVWSWFISENGKYQFVCGK